MSNGPVKSFLAMELDVLLKVGKIRLQADGRKAYFLLTESKSVLMRNFHCAPSREAFRLHKTWWKEQNCKVKPRLDA